MIYLVTTTDNETQILPGLAPTTWEFDSYDAATGHYTHEVDVEDWYVSAFEQAMNTHPNVVSYREK